MVSGVVSRVEKVPLHSLSGHPSILSRQNAQILCENLHSGRYGTRSVVCLPDIMLNGLYICSSCFFVASLSNIPKIMLIFGARKRRKQKEVKTIVVKPYAKGYRNLPSKFLIQKVSDFLYRRAQRA